MSARACFRKKRGGAGREGVSGPVSLGDRALSQRARQAHFMLIRLVFVGGFGK